MDTVDRASTLYLRGGGPLTFRHFGTPSGLMIARVILAGRTYPAVPFVRDISTVVDVGANLGAAAIFLSSMYPKARVYALEPAAASFELLCQNAAAWPNITPLRHGLGSCARRATLYHGAHDSVESSVYRNVRSSDEGEVVELQSASTFLAEQGIGSLDVLKLDAEGAEVEILETLGSVVRDIRILYVEYHSERDRRRIDTTMAETHVLWRASVELVHRGEFCYVRRDLVPEDVVRITPELL